MCGIAGIYAFNPSAPPADRAELRAIRDHMAARGPDGLGDCRGQTLLQQGLFKYVT